MEGDDSSVKGPFDLKQVTDLIEKMEIRRFRTTVVDRTALLISAGLGFVVALAWEQALKSIFTELWGSINSIPEKIGYAVAMTVVASIVAVILNRYILRRTK
jgi:hypothetical protein